MGNSAGLTKIVRWLTEWRRGQRMICASQCRELPYNLPTIELQADRPMFHSSKTMNVVKWPLSGQKNLSPQPPARRAGHQETSKFSTWCIHSNKLLAMPTLFHCERPSRSRETIFPLLFSLFCGLSQHKHQRSRASQCVAHVNKGQGIYKGMKQGSTVSRAKVTEGKYVYVLIRQ